MLNSAIVVIFFEGAKILKIHDSSKKRKMEFMLNPKNMLQSVTPVDINIQIRKKHFYPKKN